MTERVNVLRVITWLPVGGIERRLVATLPRLDRERFNVQVALVRERGPLADELEAAGIPVHLVPFRKRWDLPALSRLAGLMRREKIDIVHGHMYRANVPATVAAKLAGVGSVWCQVHNVGTWETRRQEWMDRHLCRWRTGMIAVSERVQQDVMKKLALPAERVRVIYNGVDMERFQEAGERREAVRAREGAATGDMVFLFAARLVEQKRCCDFLEAIARLQRAWAENGRAAAGRPVAWILGDGPLRDALERQAAKLPRPADVRFFGRRDDVEDFYAAADAFVLPSTREGFSNALVEAMAGALASVATDVGGNAEAIRDGRDGLIVPPLDVDRLADAMGLLWRDPDKRHALAASAAARAERFGIRKMIDAVENLYEESVPRR
jgi:glycosyltransferase involved in cell wall biosynthesis